VASRSSCSDASDWRTGESGIVVLPLVIIDTRERLLPHHLTLGRNTTVGQMPLIEAVRRSTVDVATVGEASQRAR
jgi:hypothetical protein